MKLQLEGWTEEEALECLLVGLRQRAADLDARIVNLTALVRGTAGNGTAKQAAKTSAQLLPPKTSGKKVRNLSAAARARIAAAQKKRWAAIHRSQKAAPPKGLVRRKGARIPLVEDQGE